MNSQWYKFIKTPGDLMFWSACLLLGSMPTSPFLLSVGMWGLAAAALWNIADNLPDKPRFSSLLTWIRALAVSFRNLYRQKPLLLVSLLLLAPALSLLWSDDWGYWLRVTRVRLPFLVLPLTFASLPELSARRYKLALYIMVWFMVLLCIGVGVNFIMHYDEILTGLGRGQPVPVPRQHVRFSLILATTIMAGGWLWKDRFTVKYHWERGLLGGAVGHIAFGEQLGNGLPVEEEDSAGAARRYDDPGLLRQGYAACQCQNTEEQNFLHRYTSTVDTNDSRLNDESVYPLSPMDGCPCAIPASGLYSRWMSRR